MLTENIGGDLQKQHTASHQLMALFKKHNSSPLSGLWNLVQPITLLFPFWSLLAICNAAVPGISTGGVAWFTNLSVADPTFVLPMVIDSKGVRVWVC